MTREQKIKKNWNIEHRNLHAFFLQIASAEGVAFNIITKNVNHSHCAMKCLYTPILFYFSVIVKSPLDALYVAFITRSIPKLTDSYSIFCFFTFQESWKNGNRNPFLLWNQNILIKSIKFQIQFRFLWTKDLTKKNEQIENKIKQ